MGLGVEDWQIPYDAIGCLVNSGYPTPAAAAAPGSIFAWAEIDKNPKRLPPSCRQSFDGFDVVAFPFTQNLSRVGIEQR
jgi:hypothetical protein